MTCEKHGSSNIYCSECDLEQSQGKAMTEDRITPERFFIDHGVIHDRLTSRHVAADFEDDWQDRLLALLNEQEEKLHSTRVELLNLVQGVSQIAGWPDGGNRYGQTKIKAFASNLLARRAAETNPAALAVRFHEIYERLAPSFGYETRTDTRTFDPTSKNGKLMIAVCGELLAARAAETDMVLHLEEAAGVISMANDVLSDKLDPSAWAARAVKWLDANHAMLSARPR